MRTNQQRTQRPERTSTGKVLHVATISSADGVLWTAIEWSHGALLDRLAVYVQSKAPTMLWADDAREALALLAIGEVELAVDLYFSRVGDRWDPEYLHRQVVQPG